MITLSALCTNAAVHDGHGRLVASVESICDGVIRLKDIPEWSPREPYLQLTEVERTDNHGIHLKPVTPGRGGKGFDRPDRSGSREE